MSDQSLCLDIDVRRRIDARLLTYEVKITDRRSQKDRWEMLQIRDHQRSQTGAVSLFILVVPILRYRFLVQCRPIRYRLTIEEPAIELILIASSYGCIMR